MQCSLLFLFWDVLTAYATGPTLERRPWGPFPARITHLSFSFCKSWINFRLQIRRFVIGSEILNDVRIELCNVRNFRHLFYNESYAWHGSST